MSQPDTRLPRFTAKDAEDFWWWVNSVFSSTLARHGPNFERVADWLNARLAALAPQQGPEQEQKALPEITAERLFEMLPSDVFGVANITSKQARAVCKVLAEKLTTLLSGNPSLSSPSAGRKEEPSEEAVEACRSKIPWSLEEADVRAGLRAAYAAERAVRGKDAP